MRIDPACLDPHIELLSRQELSAARAAVEGLANVVLLKQESGIPLTPETRAALTQLEMQISGLLCPCSPTPPAAA
jgi:hypothetical protein